MASVTLACQFCTALNKIEPARYDHKPKCAECGRPFLLDRPVKVHEEHFETTVLGAEVPVIVDFYADWCGPCLMMSPLLDELAKEKAGKVLVVKVDTDASPAVSQRYGIRSIPFIARFENGEITKTVVGAVGREVLLELAAVDGEKK